MNQPDHFNLDKYINAQQAFFRAATLQLASGQGPAALSAAAEWLPDNSYLVQQTCRQICEDMPPGFHRQLPKLVAGPLSGFSRIYAIAQRVVATSGAQLDIQHVRRWLRLYQALGQLTTGEIWALPVMLRLVLVELLAQAASRITGVGKSESLPLPSWRSAISDDEQVAHCIISLRLLATHDWQRFFESVSGVERLLRDDPAHVYPRMDRETRDRYRKVVERLALATGADEQSVARAAIELARAQSSPRTSHVGYFLVDAGRAQLDAQVGYHAPLPERTRRWTLDHPTLVYLGGIWAIALALLLAVILYAANSGANLWQLAGAGLLLLVPLLTISVSVINWIISVSLAPRVLPKMDFEDGIPADCLTLVVIPSLLSSTAEVNSLLRQLELHFLRSQDTHLYFALLTDFPDTTDPHTPEHDPLVKQAIAGVEALNDKYPRETASPFYLFHREPRWNPSEGKFMGWERKRGKLHQLNLMLRGKGQMDFRVQTGDLDVLRRMRFVITLDADTLMPSEAAQRLVGTLAHPLNRAEFDPERGTVTAGYTLLQPGIEITSTSVTRSRFTRIFAGDVGLDLYSRAVSNAYQDLFGEGIYVGKGIYDIDAFERSLAGRMPENALLSHDLIEGIHGRVGLVTDVVLYEDYPPHYFVYQRRSQRWIRGDWQLLPWLLPRVPSVGKGTIPNDLSVIGRWKILDNLRRSLLAPALLALFVAGWLGLPGSPWAWTWLGIITPGVPVLTGLVSDLIRTAKGSPWRNVLRALRTGLVRWVLALIFILFETSMTIGGIGTTLFRLLVTRRGLLQWTSYAHQVRASAGGVTFNQIIAAFLSVAGLTALIALFNASALVPAAPLLIAWLFSPAIADWISRPAPPRLVPLSVNERQRLRNIARRTWFFFEQFVGPEDHWLPPDHFQQSPRGAVVHSTSPTNLGLLLLSTLGAFDLGYIGLENLIVRLRSTLENMERMEKYQGHLFNWYDTRTLEPLRPSYVSTVDSGNLVACLRALAQGCQSLAALPVLRWESWEGLLDTLNLLDDVARELEPKAHAPLSAHVDGMRDDIQAARTLPDTWAALLERLLGDGNKELTRLLSTLVESETAAGETETLHRLSRTADRVQYHLYGMQREMDQLAPWLKLLTRPPGLVTRSAGWQGLHQALAPIPTLEAMRPFATGGLASLDTLKADLNVAAEAPDEIREALDWCACLAEQLHCAAMAAEALRTGIQESVQQIDSCYRDMRFGFLFDPQRQLFHIGYNVAAEKLDSNYYDLLASEARIASLVTIANDEVPPTHWLHLGRPLAHVEGMRALLSWGGTMFEYLMPTLLMRSYEGTLLQRSCLAAVDRQIAYGREKNAPWGISESGYYAFDADENYQYRTFGVPGLGFKRDLGEDLVIAPYASLLALSFRPQQVMENITRLEKLGLLGVEGFYESVDLTPARLPLGETHAVVRSYMAHHQGMILLSLVNYLRDDTMVRRLHADPLVKSAELLLQEKVPYDAPLESTQTEDEHAGQREPAPAPVIAAPWQVPASPAVPQAHFLSNGRYGVLITSAGAGYSSWEQVDLTRWRADTTREDWGTWVYVQDQESGELWSAALQPTGTPPESHAVQFYAHMAEFRRSDRGIGLTMEITVAPDEDVEVRRVSLTNSTDHVRQIALTSYAEIILAPQSADARHPAFNKMFVESEYLPGTNTLLFRRRLRSTTDEPIYLAHSAIVSPEHPITGAYETDRARFLARGRTLRAPAAFCQGGAWSATTGATLDPVMALGQTLELQPHASAQVTFITLVSGSRAKTLELVRRYQEPRVVEQAFVQARVRAEAELRQLELTATELEQIDQLFSALVYPHAALRADPATLAANRQGQSGLWAFGISGDYPILLVQMDKSDDLALVQQVLQAHAYWRNRNIKVDLVILNLQGTTYGQELRGQLQRILVRQKSEDWFNRRGGIFTLYGDQLGEADKVLLRTAARVVLDGTKGSLARQLEALLKPSTHLPLFVPVPPEYSAEPTPPITRPTDLLFDNGLGGFSADGREYVIFLEPGQWTPAPWINVIANPTFGFTVSESGSGFTWFGNSSENRLTPWSNDPVGDPPGEALYLRDEETGQVWSPTPLPCREPAPYLIRHGAGYSTFEHNSHGLVQRLRLFAAPDAPVKIVQLRLTNTWSQPRRITATYYAEWVLGVTRDTAQQYVVSEFDTECQALLARNAYQAEFGGRVAFAAASHKLHGLTADRAEFLGRMSTPGHPAALDRIGLASRVEPGLDPCAALQLHVDLKPGETQEVFFLLGQGATQGEALQLVEQYRDSERVEATWNQVNASWDALLETVQVRTPDPAMDALLNRWLLYPLLSSRVWGRSAFYQSSGAFGFRDQLQDVLALVHAAPHLARAQILESAHHQFEAGDVLHWWHPPSGRGVRTRSSDDLIWLPFITAAYVQATGDASILDETIPFLQGTPLGPGELERYDHYPPTADVYSMYEHCRRALHKGTTAGAHGLPLMGTGDWNDGMNRVGVDGRGESVWVGWFLAATLARFAELCAERGEEQQATLYADRARELSRAIESSAWDGAWYRRAYYDDGTPLGSAANQECQIDSIAQAWAVLSEASDPARAAQAMESVATRLVRPDDGLLELLTPPFDKTLHDPGYIKGYPPGVRENGGQYTHGALWAVWAFAQLGQGDRAESLFRMLNPIHHGDTPEKVAQYRVEPYVVAADVYSVSPYAGRGGWTWYTGSNGWMYRVGLEAILGISRQGKTLRINPCIPKGWKSYDIVYRVGVTVFQIRVENPAGVNRGVEQITLDGRVLGGNAFPLIEDGLAHKVHVILGQAALSS